MTKYGHCWSRIYLSDKDLNIVDNLFEYKDDEFDPIGQRYYLTKNNNLVDEAQLEELGIALKEQE